MNDPQMQLLLAEIERAIREIRTWEKDTEQLKDHSAVVYSGQNLSKSGEASGTWKVTIVVYPIPNGSRADGAATHAGQGLVVRLTPALAELAMKQAQEKR